IQTETLLVDVHIVEVSRGIQIDLEILRRGGARQPAALVLRPLDFDDLGPKSPEPARRPWPGAHPAEIHHANFFQGSRSRHRVVLLRSRYVVRTISWSYRNAYARGAHNRSARRPPSPASGRNPVPESAVSTTPRVYSHAAVLLPLPRRGSGCRAGHAANARAGRTAPHSKGRATCGPAAHRRPSLCRDRGQRWRADARPNARIGSLCRRGTPR